MRSTTVVLPDDCMCDDERFFGELDEPDGTESLDVDADGCCSGGRDGTGSLDDDDDGCCSGGRGGIGSFDFDADGCCSGGRDGTGSLDCMTTSCCWALLFCCGKVQSTLKSLLLKNA